jgi:hypothetical protein
MFPSVNLKNITILCEFKSLKIFFALQTTLHFAVFVEKVGSSEYKYDAAVVVENMNTKKCTLPRIAQVLQSSTSVSCTSMTFMNLA